MSNLDTLDFPLKIKMLRLKANKTQEELAAELGISRSCLANYETGKRQPNQKMLKKFANVFNVMSDYLLNRPSYQHVRLCEEEISEAKRIKRLIQDKGNILDISDLPLEQKIGLMKFYDYLLSTQGKDTDASEENGR